MAQFVFLSPEWLDEARRIVESHDLTGDDTTSLVVNVTVTAHPDGTDRLLHVGARQGQPSWGEGHDASAEVSLTTDHETARAIFLAGEQHVVMEALLAGRMKIQGDLAKLMTAQAAGTGPVAPGLGAELRAMTA